MFWGVGMCMGMVKGDDVFWQKPAAGKRQRDRETEERVQGWEGVCLLLQLVVVLVDSTVLFLAAVPFEGVFECF